MGQSFGSRAHPVASTSGEVKGEEEFFFFSGLVRVPSRCEAVLLVGSRRLPAIRLRGLARVLVLDIFIV